jgi:hypothetical protein
VKRRAPAASAAAPREDREPPVLVGFDKKSGKRFTGDFEDADVEDAIGQIAEAAGWSLVLPGGDHGTVTARFKDVPAEDALRAVLAHAGLTAVREGTVVRIRGTPGVTGVPLPDSLPPKLRAKIERDVRRATDEARRAADGAQRELERETRRTRRAARGENDKVVHGDVVVRPNEPARDVVAIRGSIKVEPGAEVRDAVAVLGDVTLGPGAHAHQVVAVGGDVKLGPGAVVSEDVVAVGGEVLREVDAEIGGEEVSVGIPALSGLASLVGARRESPGLVLGQSIAKFLVFFLLGLLLVSFFPRRVDAVAASFQAHPWKSIFTGLLGLVLTPLLVVLLVVTVIGIPLVPVAALMLVAAGVLGFTALAFFIGRRLPIQTRRGTNVLQLAIGTALVVLVTAIPILGGMAWFAAALLGFGAVLRSRFGSQTPPPALPTTPYPPAASPPPAPPPAAA